METADKEKLAIEILSKDLDAVRKIEAWGSGLFLTAIGLAVKQVADWHAADAMQNIPIARHWAYAAPFALGLVGFAFLRVVNQRSYYLSCALWDRAGVTDHRRFGGLGWCLALMPLLVGGAASFVLGTNVGWLFGLGLFAVAVAVAWHVRRRRLQPLQSLRSMTRWHRAASPSD
jgi:hypothetical protein